MKLVLIAVGILLATRAVHWAWNQLDDRKLMRELREIHRARQERDGGTG